jgi:hypothetical protein
MGGIEMGLARRSVLEQALIINKIILHAFEEGDEKKEVEKIEKQIKETEEKINGKE